MLQQFVRPAKAVAACLTLMSAVACSATSAIDSPNAPSSTSTIARTDAPVDPPPPPPPPPTGGEGCTPGYWKQPHHFDSWPAPYAPGDTFASRFGVDSFGDDTLLEVLGANGGGLNALGRHAVAALLNGASAGVTYDMSSAQVITAFNAAVDGGDIEGTKNIFAAFNEQGCKLD
jgi:hypothetical protein